MATEYVSLLGEPETRRPSKRLTFIVLFILLLGLALVFITLYFKEKDESTHSPSDHTKPANEQSKSTNLPTEQIQSTNLPPEMIKPINLPHEQTKS